MANKVSDRVKWIKIVTGMFDDEAIQLIEAMPDGDTIIVIWVKLLCLAGKCNAGGLLMKDLVNTQMVYTDEMLATVFRRPLNTVRMALDAFETLGMVEIVDHAYYVTNWDKHQNIEGMDKIREQNRLRQAKRRAKLKEEKALPEPNDVSRDTSRDVTHPDIDIDKDIDIEDIYISDSDESDTPAKGGGRTKGKKKKPKGPNPPSGIDEVEAYVKEKGLNVDAKRFYDFFAAGNWYDSNGKPVLNWKQKLLTWDKYNTGGKGNEGYTGNNDYSISGRGLKAADY